jgi:hypothetical protein
MHKYTTHASMDNNVMCGGLVVNLFSYSQDTKALVFSIHHRVYTEDVRTYCISYHTVTPLVRKCMHACISVHEISAPHEISV